MAELLTDTGDDGQNRRWRAVGNRIGNCALAVAFTAFAVFFVFVWFAAGGPSSWRFVGMILFCAGVGGAFWIDFFEPKDTWWMFSLECTFALAILIGMVLWVMT